MELAEVEAVADFEEFLEGPGAERGGAGFREGGGVEAADEGFVAFDGGVQRQQEGGEGGGLPFGDPVGVADEEGDRGGGVAVEVEAM
ncbi:MAG: hypothetical protein U0232_11660 [Thermomicrobiales bacterium]